MTPHILIIDDDPIMQHIMAHLLHKRGYDVQTAGDGANACRVLESYTPDIICVDMVMPDITGVDMLRCIRTEMKLAHIPVILLSSTFRDDLVQEAKQLGISRWLSKPITSDQLAETIDAILSDEALADRNGKTATEIPPAENDP